jgi:Kef-type K+ transport system membrane component KefB
VTFSLTSLAVVAATGFAAPLLIELVPGARFPNVVAEIGLGILVGPSVLGWAHADEPVQVLALIGLSFLLLIAGLEVDYERLRGRLLRVTGLGFAISVALGLVAGVALHEAGLVRSPLLIAIMFSATGLGIVIAVLKDAGRVETPFGQLVIAGSSIAEVGTIVLLTLSSRASRAASGRSEVAASALLQATSVSFFVVATEIGRDTDLISAANAAAVVAAGLLSVLLFPLAALTVLRRSAGAPAAEGLEELPLGLGR